MIPAQTDLCGPVREVAQTDLCEPVREVNGLDLFGTVLAEFGGFCYQKCEFIFDRP